MFYDLDGDPIEPGPIIVKGKLFTIADLPSHGLFGEIVGLFIEDDEQYFLKATFSRYWLRDLMEVSTKSVVMMPYVKP